MINIIVELHHCIIYKCNNRHILIWIWKRKGSFTYIMETRERRQPDINDFYMYIMTDDTYFALFLKLTQQNIIYIYLCCPFLPNCAIFRVIARMHCDKQRKFHANIKYFVMKGGNHINLFRFLYPLSTSASWHTQQNLWT